MIKDYSEVLFAKAPIAMSVQKCIRNNLGEIIDYELVSINEAFIECFKSDRTTILHQKLSELVMLPLEARTTLISAFMAALSVEGGDIFFVIFQSTKKEIMIHPFLLDQEYSACLYQIPKEMEFVTDEIRVNEFVSLNLTILSVLDASGRFYKINDKFEKVLGYSEEEIRGEKIENFFRILDSEEETEQQEIKYGQKTVTVYTTQFLCKDGSYRYLELNFQKGRGNYIYTSAKDVTETKKMSEKLMKIAIKDELTGLKNRHYLDMTIEEEMEKRDRQNECLSMAILDIDLFKNVNDTWGHPIGDVILKQVAQTAKDIMGKEQIVIRFGGEEFVIIMKKMCKEEAVFKAEQIRCAIEEMEHPVVGKITVSLGVAQRVHSESFLNWYRRADKALYHAKKSGRNLVILAEDEAFYLLSEGYLTWQKKWESGNQIIDAQHKKLLESANSLVEYSLVENNEVVLKKQINIIIQEISDHFLSEEEILSDLGYQKIESHRQIHRRLMEKAYRLQEKYENGDVVISAFFSFLIDDVIFGHLEDTDAKFFSYIAELKTPLA